LIRASGNAIRRHAREQAASSRRSLHAESRRTRPVGGDVQLVEPAGLDRAVADELVEAAVQGGAPRLLEDEEHWAGLGDREARERELAGRDGDREVGQRPRLAHRGVAPGEGGPPPPFALRARGGRRRPPDTTLSHFACLPQTLREKHDTKPRRGFCLADDGETLPPIERQRGRVRRAGLDDGVSNRRLDCERAADERRTDASAEVSRVNDQPMKVDRVADDSPGDRAGDGTVHDPAKEGLAAALKLSQRLVEGRDREGPDQLGLDPIRPSLKLQQL
jgi:hypothetical protein